MLNVDALASARHSVACFLVSSPGVRWYHALRFAAERGVAVDLFLPASSVGRLDIAEPYLDRLRAAGGRCFLLHLQPVDWQRLRLSPRNLSLIDEADTPQIIGDQNGALAKDADQVANVFQRLRALGHLADGVRLKHHLSGLPSPRHRAKRMPDVALSFSASAASVPCGRSVGLSWAAVGADRVEITPGPGEVGTRGDLRISITEATEFTLTAYQGARSFSRVLHVGAAPVVTLDYWLLVGENTPTSRARPPASSPELPDHFGMAAGLLLTLHWRAQNASLVCLDGQALPGTAGSVRLDPEGRTVYQLLGVGTAGDEVRRTITVKTFHPPALKHPEPKLDEKTSSSAGILSWIKSFTP